MFKDSFVNWKIFEMQNGYLSFKFQLHKYVELFYDFLRDFYDFERDLASIDYLYVSSQYLFETICDDNYLTVGGDESWE